MATPAQVQVIEMRLGALLDSSPTSEGQHRASVAAGNRTSADEKCRCSMETQSYPISVRVIGVMHKEKSKVRAQTGTEDTFLRI